MRGRDSSWLGWLPLAILLGLLLAAGAGLAFCGPPPVSVSVPKESP
jgi:hypothetical protein